jgi:hypothetical protein
LAQVSALVERAERRKGKIIDATVGATFAFPAEHPDAPRPRKRS